MKVDVFVDESGVSRNVGCSVYCFTLITKDKKQFIDEKIVQFEKNHEIPPFHWREQTWRLKRKFIKFIKSIDDWNSIVAVVDNKTYPYLLPTEVVAKALLGIEIGTLYIDGKKTQKYIHTVKKSLKELGLEVSHLKMVKASSVGGLRISDAIAGLVRVSLEEKLEEDVKAILKSFYKNKISAQVISGYLSNPPYGR